MAILVANFGFTFREAWKSTISEIRFLMDYQQEKNDRLSGTHTDLTKQDVYDLEEKLRKEGHIK